MNCTGKCELKTHANYLSNRPIYNTVALIERDTICTVIIRSFWALTTRNTVVCLTFSVRARFRT